MVGSLPGNIAPDDGDKESQDRLARRAFDGWPGVPNDPLHVGDCHRLSCW